MDADAVMLRPPFDMVPQSPVVQYAYQVNFHGSGHPAPQCDEEGPAEGNTGVYWVRSTPAMIQWFAVLSPAACQRQPHLDDQTVFWQLWPTIRLPRNNCGQEPADPVCRLSVCLTPCGFVQFRPTAAQTREWLRNVTAPWRVPLLIHLNYLSGGHAKEQLLKSLGLWLADSSDIAKCSPKRLALWHKLWDVPIKWNASQPSPSRFARFLSRFGF